jgi:alpha-D-ribose 1-methylphosphonate 5-triphosphate synthase subunit PhnG
MTDIQSRRRWLSVLAKATTEELEAIRPEAGLELLRAPEIGLVMVRGRAGATGRRFNLGEVTVTRCAVRAADGTIGHGHVQGRDKRKARLVAELDAVLQTSPDPLAVIAPLARAQEARRAAVARKAAATRVEFFTLVRGDE